MQNTTNLKLKKPENTDPVEIQDFNDNADILDQAIAEKVDKAGDGSNLTNKFVQAASRVNLVSGEKQSVSFGKIVKYFADLKAAAFSGNAADLTPDATHRFTTDTEKAAWNAKVTASGGDIADTKVSAFTASTAAYPVPVAGETPRVFMGKVKKFFEDMNNLRASMLFIGSIVNNCVTNNASLPLSAAQGKALMDLYTQLNSDKANSGIIHYANIDNVNTSGIYLVREDSGLLLHMQWDVNYSFQLFNAYPSRGYRTRSKVGNIWSSWVDYGVEDTLVWDKWMKFYKKNGIVIVNIVAVRSAGTNNIDANTAYPVATLPQSYCPPTLMEITCKARVGDVLSNSGMAIVTIKPSGVVELRTDRKYTSTIEFDGCGCWTVE